MEPFLILGGVITAVSNILSRKNNDNKSIRRTKLPFFGKSKFEAKIKNNKIQYDRKTDEINFILTYKGKIKQGFIACEIVPPYSFDIPFPNIDDEGHLSIFCDDSVKQIDSKQTIKNIKKIHQTSVMATT